MAQAFRPVTRGAEYTVWGYTRSADAASARALHCRLSARDHLRQPVSRRRPNSTVPAFGTPEHAAWARDYFENDFDGARYRPLYDATQRIAGKATNPYAATVAIEAWLRSSGGFTYDETPPRVQGGRRSSSS